MGLGPEVCYPSEQSAAPGSTDIDVDRIFRNPLAAGDQADNTADVAANIVNFSHRKAVFKKSSDQPFFAYMDNMEVFHVVLFKVAIRTWRRFIESIL
jgi:hypothetical protein